MDNADGLLCSEDMGSPWSEEDTTGYSSDEEFCIKNYFAPDFPAMDYADLACIFEKECSYMPDVSYLEVLMQESVLVARSNAVQWIVKVCRGYRFRPLTVALAINYLDRYLSKHLTKSWKAWMIQLTSIACLSLGAKMEEINVPILVDLQVQGSAHLFDPKTVQRMELSVLSSLDWRMSSVTVFSFLDDLLLKLGLNKKLQKSIAGRVTELVFGTYLEAVFLEFRPSTITLAAIRCALEELSPLQAETYVHALIKKLPVEAILDRCYSLMEEVVADPVGPLHSSSQVHGASKPPVSPVNLAETSQRRIQYLGGVSNAIISTSCLKRDDLCQDVQDVLRSFFSKSRKRKLDVTIN